MTDDQSRRPDPSLNPDELPTDELPADELPEDELPEGEPPREAEAEAEAEAEPFETEPAPTPEPGPAAAPTATRPARAPKATSGKAARDVGYRGSLPPRNDRIARPWVITVLGIFVLIFVLAIAGLPSRLLPDATPAPIPSFSLEPSPISSPQ